MNVVGFQLLLDLVILVFCGAVCYNSRHGQVGLQLETGNQESLIHSLPLNHGVMPLRLQQQPDTMVPGVLPARVEQLPGPAVVVENNGMNTLALAALAADWCAAAQPAEATPHANLARGSARPFPLVLFLRCQCVFAASWATP